MNKLFSLIIIVISIIVYFIFKDIKYSIILLLLYYLYLYYLNNKKRKEIQKEKQDKEYEFANLVSYLLIFLENNFNVYQSLLLTMSYCKESLAKDIETLIEEIDFDKSIAPYQNFAKKFETNIIYQLVMMIYQLDINGYDVKYLHNFPLLIENIRQAKIENMIAIRKSNMSYLMVLPIISLLIVVFSLSFFILTLIGGSIIWVIK